MATGYRTSFLMPKLPSDGSEVQSIQEWAKKNIKNEIMPGMIKNGYLHLYQND